MPKKATSAMSQMERYITGATQTALNSLIENEEFGDLRTKSAFSDTERPLSKLMLRVALP
jgi:hypothetical protein